MTYKVSDSGPVEVGAFAQAAADTSVDTSVAGGARATDTQDSRLLNRFLARLERRVSSAHLARLLRYRGQILTALGNLPDRMHLVANQTQLILELAEDYRTGVYRRVPWRSIGIMAAIAAYMLSPLDLIPDVLGGIGLLDDMVLVGVGARLMRRDLEAYCAFKGYDPARYFELD